MSAKRVSRREFLRLAALGGVGLAATGCVVATPQVVEKIVTQEVEKVVTATPAPEAAKVLHWGRNPGENDAVWSKIVDVAQDVYPELEIELNAPPENWDQKRLLTIAAGIGPDSWPSGLANFRSDIGFRVIQNIQPWLDEEPEVMERLRNEFVPASIVGPSFEGQLFGIPIVTEAIVLWYHKDAIEEAGLTPPREIEDDPEQWNWDTMREYALAINKGTGFTRERFGFYCLGGKHPWGMSESWGNLVYARGGRVLSEDGLNWTMNTPETAEALQYIVDLTFEDDVHPNAGDLSAAGARDRTMFQNGQLGMVVSGEYFRRYLWGSNAPSEGIPFEYDLAQMPFCPPTGKRTNIYHGIATVMSSQAKNPDAVWKWLKVLSTLEAQEVISQNWGSRAAHRGTHPGWIATNAGDGPDGLNYETISKADADTIPYPSSPVATVFELMDPVVRLWYDNIMVGTMSVQDGLDQMEAECSAILEKGLMEFESRV